MENLSNEIGSDNIRTGNEIVDTERDRFNSYFSDIVDKLEKMRSENTNN